MHTHTITNSLAPRKRKDLQCRELLLENYSCFHQSFSNLYQGAECSGTYTAKGQQVTHCYVRVPVESK